MKYIRHLAVALLCCLILALPVMALSSASGFSGDAVVSADGSCQVSLTVTLRLDNPQSDLTFPLPKDATDVKLAGQSVQTKVSGEKLLVVLPAMSAGEHILMLHYRLPCVVTAGEEMVLTLPLLSGFSLPIEQLKFSVTLPGPTTGQPVFTSGYYQQNIRVETSLTEYTLHCTVATALKDHETLSLTVPVDENAFTLALEDRPWMTRWDFAMVGLIAVAMAYFCLTLLPRFTRHSRSFTAPEGITAGEVGCCLTGCGTDLTTTVLSWAQSGYIQIEIDKRGRILLHKRMEMGNERSYHEGRIFQMLFSRRLTVDATGAYFGRLSRKVSGRSPLLRQIFKPRSGDPRIFRGLCCAAAMCCGVQMGTGFLAVVMALLCILFSYCIQLGCRCIPLRNKLPLLAAVVLGILWIWFGSLCDTLGRVIFMVLFQFLSGVFCAYGGKRSEMGQRVLSQILGLRRHMTGADAFDMQVLLQKNPNYFYELAPYALAMGIDRQFARRFDSKTQLPECGWLKNAPRMTPPQCAARLRRIANAMDKAKYSKR